MPETLTRKKSGTPPPRPIAWKQGDHVRLRPDVCHHAKYSPVRFWTGEIELANESDPFSPLGPIANVRFFHDQFPNGVLIRDIPFPHLEPAPAETEPEKQKRRSPLNMKVVKDTRTEAAKMEEGRQWLVNPDRGYIVLVSGQYIKKVQCPECYDWFWPEGFGNSVGYPDMTVFHPERWTERGPIIPPLFIEWKRYENSERGPEQIKLVNMGVSCFVWSLLMMIERIVAFERQLGFEPHPDALDYLERHAPKTKEVPNHA